MILIKVIASICTFFYLLANIYFKDSAGAGVNYESEDVFPQSLQPRRMRNARVTILKEIIRTKIKMDDDLVKENKAVLAEFLESFLIEMRKDNLFDLLYRNNYYTGSFYSGLRISMPDEYDINIVLKLPLKAHEIQVEFNPQTPSYAKYKIKNHQALQSTHEKLLRTLCKDGYLIPEKLRTWIQSVVDKAMLTYRLPPSCSRIVPSSAGPAKTIYLHKKGGGQIDIDLVPAFECTLQDKPPGIDGRVYNRVKNNLRCFLVPKPYQTAKQAPISPSEQVCLWRTHYPDAENDLIKDLGCVKPIIKLLKLLRDKENWKILASYYLKTAIMWMILENPNKEYWKEDKMGDRFLDALRRLANYCAERKLPYFFSSKCNLLVKINGDLAYNIQCRLYSIIKDIEKDDWNLWKIFSAEPTFNQC